MKSFKIVVLFLFIASAAYAKVDPTEKVATTTPPPMGESRDYDVRIQIKGMVCGFCAQGIEKKMKALAEVSKIKVSLESKNVDVDLKDGTKVSDEQLKKIITEAGYEVVKIEREI